MLIKATAFRITLFANAQTVLRRFCHTSEHVTAIPEIETVQAPVVRVRFAPSPTGYLHLGGLRTALYNYLFAKKNNGKFILRIEDTDQTRCIQGATERLCSDLEWAGIVPDEGPIHDGPCGPYIQSKRLDIYRQEVKKLLDNGTAYYCFCTERRLELLRKEALKARQVPKYDNRCRHLTPVQIAEKLANQDTFCIRFKLDPFIDEFNDLVYGKIVYDVFTNEGDPVIIKSDGYPTYHFANVVDDHLMKISHVFRGVEWQISTTKHLLIYKAFNWTPPKYAHLPLLMNSDGTKLSKRQGNVNIEHYRSKGIQPLALINYITKCGGGFDHSSAVQCCTMNELQEQFNITKLNTNSSRLNPDLLGECNRLDLKRQIRDPDKEKEIIQEVRKIVIKAFPNSLNTLDLDENHIKNVLLWCLTRITTLHDLVEKDLSFLWHLPEGNLKSNLSSDLVADLTETLRKEEFDKPRLHLVLKDFSGKKGLQYNNFMQSLRDLLSGKKEGPGVAEMMEILGKETTLQRLKQKTKP